MISTSLKDPWGAVRVWKSLNGRISWLEDNEGYAPRTYAVTQRCHGHGPGSTYTQVQSVFYVLFLNGHVFTTYGHSSPTEPSTQRQTKELSVFPERMGDAHIAHRMVAHDKVCPVCTNHYVSMHYFLLTCDEHAS